MINLDQSIEKIKAEVAGGSEGRPARDFLIEVGVREKEGQGRKTLLTWLREEVKKMSVESEITVKEVFAEVDEHYANLSKDLPADAPREPPPGYKPTPDYKPTPEAEIEVDKPVESVAKVLMQEVDPRPCNFPFQNMDMNLNPVCNIHNSGICFPCQDGTQQVLRCRVVCFAESPKHRNIKQPIVVMKEKTIEGNPASVEAMDVSKFDE